MNRNLYLIIAIGFLIQCKKPLKHEMKNHQHTNQLIHETSPYLLQHAHNPVNWYAWNKETLDLAKKENKLILISIGYAACHWCHVMENESFEDEAVAQVMNDHYINIKIDREERPDIDQIYMTAIQIMTGAGGWPLNCVALPDGRPIWGGTYFPKKQWTTALSQIAKLHRKDPDKVIEYATQLTEGVQKSGLISVNTAKLEFKKEDILIALEKWTESFDQTWGGNTGAPKFPMPNNLHFLLRHATQNKNNNLSKHVYNTLDKMALGGIFDQVGGGFARYSTDEKWHIPHFEKMLYDNAQLVSLYADAFLISQQEIYKETVYNTLDFIEKELTSTEGAFYSALDADSNTLEGHLEEGTFYVWTKKELRDILGKDFELFANYYNINDFGYWEDEKYNLIRNTSDQDFADRHQLDLKTFKHKVSSWKKALFRQRSQREHPRLDNKTLTSWNALMLKGYIDAYRVFGDEKFLNIALKNAHFLKRNQLRFDGGLNHSYKNGKSTINGYLEDYSTVIDAYIALHQITMNEEWLQISKNLTDYCFVHFFDKTTNMFFFTSNQDEDLIARKTEIYDNVIPASNSIMARNLFALGNYFNNTTYTKTAQKMLHNVKKELQEYPSGHSNWLQLYSDISGAFFEVAILGTNARAHLNEIQQYYIPNKLIAVSTTNSTLPLLKHRFQSNKTLIYVCVDGTCKQPVSDSKKAVSQMKETKN
jgi:uncharacterized protein YyaL (SSP411 family)